MEIKLDQNSLPADQQHIRFQIVLQELHGIWHEGIYIADEDIFKVNDDVWYDLWSEIVRWEPINREIGTH
ncbi:hypothetical protein HDE69_002598 [Pedobacter cryoconitis]|uniref:Uncharacterized protein n=1 Tax=Pedobacter cryoconitis TaxID=188932 RepID=A0A7W8YTL7_9SPHI|nr:hypothetical protein [Pedobacter cryoconitis]MBB5621537.1 hypothetical protein [Pedobacter cryoconitis]MBB5643872.1 hypothetical protein [Pedobacter cryoconitis]